MDQPKGNGDFPTAGEKSASALPHFLSRGAGIAILASIAVLFLVFWARSVLIPITLGIFLRYALMPVVVWLQRYAKLPRPIGAALVLLLLVGGIAFGLFRLQGEALDLLDKVPAAAHKFERAVRKTARDEEGTLSKLTKAASELDRAATSATQPTTQPAPPKAHETKLPQLSTYLWTGSLTLAIASGQAFVVLALAYFLLIAGNEFRRKIVRISARTLSEKKITVHILQEIDLQIQRYLFVQLGTSILDGVATWFALSLIGLENAAFWGLIAGIFHLIPYVGPTIVIVLTTIIAYLQFPEFASVLLVPASQLFITGAIGFGVMPWLTGRFSHLNPVTVFVALLVWGWLWGIWGLLLGVPIVMAVHAVCARIPDLHAFADLLGSERAPADALPILHTEPEDQ